MKTYDVTVTATITVPSDLEEVFSADGYTVGFKRPDGSILKPWLVFEHQSDEGGERDLSEKELSDEFGIDIEYDHRDMNEVVTQ